MASNRIKRISEEVRKVISTMLINGIKDPRITSMVSVTDVEVTNDLRYAFVYISILGGDEESTLQGLNSARGYIRREVGRAVKLRYVPEVIFKIDDSIERGMYMDELIKKVSEEEKKEEKDPKGVCVGDDYIDGSHCKIKKDEVVDEYEDENRPADNYDEYIKEGKKEKNAGFETFDEYVDGK